MGRELVKSLSKMSFHIIWACPPHYNLKDRCSGTLAISYTRDPINHKWYSITEWYGTVSRHGRAPTKSVSNHPEQIYKTIYAWNPWRCGNCFFLCIDQHILSIGKWSETKVNTTNISKIHLSVKIIQNKGLLIHSHQGNSINIIIHNCIIDKQQATTWISFTNKTPRSP